MKKARLILGTSLFTLAGFASIGLVSCSKDDVTCNVGYEGEDCKTLSRTKFIGDWRGSENCTISTAPDEYTISIVASGSSEIQVVVSNIYNEDFVANGTIVSSNKFTFADSEDGTTYSGDGTLNAEGELVLNYTITSTAVSNSCTFTGTKR